MTRTDCYICGKKFRWYNEMFRLLTYKYETSFDEDICRKCADKIIKFIEQLKNGKV